MGVIEWFMQLPDVTKAAAITATILFLLYLRIRLSKHGRIKRSIRKSKLIYYQDFEANWRNSDGSGYKYNDRSGCYVITLYNHRITARVAYMHYENIYIGQSQNVCQRVHNHFQGKSNKGDVYADIKYGMEAYVRIIPCKEKRLNELEKELIEAFGATESYNRTRGGAKGR